LKAIKISLSKPNHQKLLTRTKTTQKKRISLFKI